MPDPSLGGWDRLNERATTWLALAGSVALAIMMLLTFIDVVGRYLFSLPFTGTVEMTELLMGLMIYLGIGLTTHDRGHIRVDLLVTRLSPRGQATLELITGAIALAFVALIVWQLWLRAQVNFDKNDMTQIWEWPVWPVAFTMAAGSLFLLSSMILLLLKAWQDLVRAPGPS
jgi:TRAP-type C4-dicarboxylate transport system permease small subunit